MARMPDALWHGEHGSVTMTEASLNKVCVHTIVGNPPANAAHFSVRADGLIYQSRDTRFRSAANAYGNDDVIAIENDDHGPEYGSWNVNDGHAVPGFTAAQVEANARIIVWAYRTHGIPIVLCPDSRDASEGIAYHRQGIDGNYVAEGYRYGGRVAGGEVWSESRGKVCPGDRRITQLIQLIIPRARVLAGLDSPQPLPTVKEDDNVRTYYVKGDGTGLFPNRTDGVRYGDALFMVETSVDGLRRRHVSGNEWAVAQAGGAQIVQRPQSWVDSIPLVGELFWWENDA